MLVLVSHAVCFLTLFAGSVQDLLTTEVSDQIPAVAVASGILLHAAASYLGATWMPLKWSIAVGAVFSIYGWGMYYLGMWGGADAFSLSALGFAAPYSLSGFGAMHSINLFVNIMIVGFVYTLAYAFYKAYDTGGVVEATLTDIKKEKFRFVAELGLATMFGVLALVFFNANIWYPVLAVSMVVLYRFLKQLEDGVMETEKPVDELEEGEVVTSGEVGKQVKGITEEEIRDLDVEKVTVKTGVRFVPVFPVALLITDIYGGGMQFLIMLFSL